MKKVYYISALIIMAIALMSNRGGRGSASGTNGAVTGAPGENGGSCGQSSCHSAGNFSPSLDLFLIDENGDALDKYIPGASYTVSLKINTSGLPSGYGFQMVCLEDTDNSSTGNFSDLPDRTSTINLLDRQYVEQFNTIPVDSIPLTWTAPEKGTGNITFYAIGNAVNGNGSPGGDGVARSSFSFEEAEESSTTEQDLDELYSVYPNPVAQYLNVNGPTTDLDITIFDTNGNVVAEKYNSDQLDCSSLAAGMYLVRMQTTQNEAIFKKILKI